MLLLGQRPAEWIWRPKNRGPTAWQVAGISRFGARGSLTRIRRAVMRLHGSERDRRDSAGNKSVNHESKSSHCSGRPPKDHKEKMERGGQILSKSPVDHLRGRKPTESGHIRARRRQNSALSTTTCQPISMDTGGTHPSARGVACALGRPTIGGPRTDDRVIAASGGCDR
jgi:hypothetical protein